MLTRTYTTDDENEWEYSATVDGVKFYNLLEKARLVSDTCNIHINKNKLTLKTKSKTVSTYFEGETDVADAPHGEIETTVSIDPIAGEYLLKEYPGAEITIEHDPKNDEEADTLLRVTANQETHTTTAQETSQTIEDLDVELSEEIIFPSTQLTKTLQALLYDDKDGSNKDNPLRMSVNNNDLLIEKIIVDNNAKVMQTWMCKNIGSVKNISPTVYSTSLLQTLTEIIEQDSSEKIALQFNGETPLQVNLSDSIVYVAPRITTTEKTPEVAIDRFETEM